MNGTGRGRGRGGRGRGRGRGRARGRGKKVARVESSDEECSQNQLAEDQSTDEPPPPIEPGAVAVETDETAVQLVGELVEVDAVVKDAVESVKVNEPATITGPLPIDMEADISQLEAPTFTTISRGPPEPMLRLKWDHKVSLIGEKVLNPMIHCCDQCLKPILIYGRMIPCKHVFCLKCARTEPVKLCPRCKEKVCRVEQSALGSVFMCSHGGTRYGNTGCRRTYLSQRDLQAHINHRHMENSPKPPPPVPPVEITHKTNMIGNIVVNTRKPLEPAPQTSLINPRQSNTNNPTVGGNNRTNNITTKVIFPPTNNSTRNNLITVPIQDSQQNITQVIGMGGQQQGQSIADLPGNYYGSSSYSTSSGFQSNQQFATIPTISQSKSIIPPTQQIHNLSLSRTSANPGNQPYYNQPHYAPPQYGQMQQQHYQSSAGRQSYDGPNYNPGSNSSITNPSTMAQNNVSHNSWNQQQYYR